MSRSQLSPALLATELALPLPVSRDGGEVSTSEGCSPTARVADVRAFRKIFKAAVTPYQALPVQGPLVASDSPSINGDQITHHLTPALPVLEPEGRSKKVCPYISILDRLVMLWDSLSQLFNRLPHCQYFIYALHH